jgi:dihydrofolate reductase
LRTLAVTQNVTLDGSIEMLGDWFNPQGQASQDNSDLLDEIHRQDSKADGLLAGRRTFEDLRAFWSKQSEDPTGITTYLNRVQKYVVSSTMTAPQWQNSTVLSGDPVERFAR